MLTDPAARERAAEALARLTAPNCPAQRGPRRVGALRGARNVYNGGCLWLMADWRRVGTTFAQAKRPTIV